jgi:hypothetical protein
VRHSAEAAGTITCRLSFKCLGDFSRECVVMIAGQTHEDNSILILMYQLRCESNAIIGSFVMKAMGADDQTSCFPFLTHLMHYHSVRHER